MANKIVLKKSSVASKVPTTSDLDYGEVALNYADGKLYYKTASNSIESFNAGAASGVYIAGDGLSLTGSTFAVDSTVLRTTGSYSDPSWITSINYSKLTGTVPTWNQNTTGSAASLTTARTLTIGSTGKSFNGTADVSWSLTDIGAYAATNPAGYTTNTGTVTSIATGNGITGGTITTTGTLGLTGQALALHGLATSGIIARTGSGTVAARTLTAGTGISITDGGGINANPTITNSAPDQTVTLTGSGATSISGTYPNFTISSTDTNTTYSAGNGISLAGTVFSVAAGTGLIQETSGLAHADTSTQASVDNSNGTVIQDITLDTFGHITAINSLNLDDRYYTETESDSRFVNTSGDTMTGFLTLHADPTDSLHAVTKQYVDSIAQGLHVHTPSLAATPSTLASITGGTITYNNGTNGVGATLTVSGGTFGVIDGVNIATVGTRILVRAEANTAHNGIYTFTSNTVLTRAADFNTPTEMAGGDFTFVQQGTLYNDTGWVMPDPVTAVGTTGVTFSQFSGTGTYTAGTGLTLTGTQFSHTDTSSIANIDNNGNTFIQDLVFDTFGHVTGATSAAVTIGDGTLTLATSGIATGSQTFTANQSTAATFTVNVPATNIAEGTRTTTGVPITSSTGTGATLSAATTSLAGVMTSADKTKLDGIAAGATANTGTVTSVGGTGTVSGLSLSGTVTTSGNLTLGGTLSVLPSNFASQTANTVLAAPNGAAGTPTFRSLVAADIPTLNQNTTGNAANVTGTVAIANGGTGATSAAAALTNLGAYAASNPAGYTANTGTVTSVAALTIGTTGTDITSTVATGTTTPVITLNIPTASATNRGVLSAADWTTFNNKQPAGSYLTGTKVDSIAATSPIVASASTGAVTLSHAASGVTAGTYNNVTVNATGHVTGGSNVAYLTSYTESDTLASVTARGNIATNHLIIPSGEGNALGFWGGSTTYSIAMGVTAGTYQYGPVTDYSIKMNMGAGAGRGFTWGQSGVKPIAALNSTTGDMQIAGSFYAASKSFLIDHPTKEGKKLVHGSLEGPEHGVYVRGKLTGNNAIELPEYWTKLVNPDSITVNLTPIGKHQNLFVEDIADNKVIVGNSNLFGKEINCFFVVYGERVDIAKLEVEVE